MENFFEVQQKKILKLGRREWLPQQKVVEGRTFVSCSKWCPSLVKLMTGKRLDLHSGQDEQSGSLNVPVMDSILELRQTACDELLLEAMKTEEPEGEPGKGKRKKPQQAQKCLAKHIHLLPPIIDITLGEFQFSILVEGLSTGNFWLEMLAENFAWLQTEANKEPAKPRTQKPKKAEPKHAAKSEPKASPKVAPKAPPGKGKGKGKAKAKAKSLMLKA